MPQATGRTPQELGVSRGATDGGLGCGRRTGCPSRFAGGAATPVGERRTRPRRGRAGGRATPCGRPGRARRSSRSGGRDDGYGGRRGGVEVAVPRGAKPRRSWPTGGTRGVASGGNGAGRGGEEKAQCTTISAASCYQQPRSRLRGAQGQGFLCGGQGGAETRQRPWRLAARATGEARRRPSARAGREAPRRRPARVTGP